MRHEKIIKRDDGSRVRLIIYIKGDGYSSKFEYEVVAHKCDPKKRTWHSTFDVYSQKYRALSIEERKEVQEKSVLTIASKEEILEAKLELWQLIKPV